MTAIHLRRPRRVVLVGAVCAGLVAAGGSLTACGADPDAGTNGVGKLTAAEIQTRTRTAARSARTVRLSGAVVSGDHTYKLDMRLKANGGSGSVTSEGSTFQLLRVDDELFLKAGAAFWRNRSKDSGKDSQGDSAAADKLDGKYVRVPKGDPAYQQLSGFTSKNVLLDGLLTLQGRLDKGDHHRMNGVRAVEITGDKGEGGTLDVSLEGKPYPVNLDRAGNAGTLSFTDWDKAFDLTEPDKSETVDYGKQLPTS